MDGADLSKTAMREPSIRGQLAELTERQGWVHHVVDVDTGEVLTAPLNWLSVYDPVISLPDAQDHVYWSLPEDLQPSTDLPGLRSHFDEPPAQRCVATLVFAAASWAGAVGHIRIAGSATGRIPIAGNYAEHTVDLSFAPFPGSPVEIFVFLEPGLHQVVFYSITLQAERVIIGTPSI